jgi:D-glycero-alpha-D-manno-heptose-7-phosphate kinase
MVGPEQKQPLRIINSVAPIRICDNGGWTDTWFSGHGKIFNIGVYPYAEVQIEVYPYDGQEDRIIVHAENYGERYALCAEKPGWDRIPCWKQPLNAWKRQRICPSR